MAVHPFVHAQDLSERGDSLRPSIALKTNVLYDMVLTPNFEIEKDLGRHLSLDVETAFPWYTWHRNLRCYEVFEAGGELRWWTGHFATTRQRRLTGFFLGLYGAGGITTSSGTARDIAANTGRRASPGVSQDV